ncbi:hypothetical protein OHA70_11420 [Kribbella sp. NBC_00382]|uniref:hypothetical protein n=1 Tax=Kribbella sp. NBC_00382 TaxID=2975967 RepID=UPI002E1F9E0C
MNDGFRVPSIAELKAWAVGLGADLPDEDAARLQWNLRVSVQLFTKSALASAVIALAGIAATSLIGRSSPTAFWPVYAVIVSVSLALIYSHRALVGTLWPRMAAEYYLVATINRLRAGPRFGQSDADYLRIILPSLEESLLRNSMIGTLAGSRAARQRLRSTLVLVIQDIGEAELMLADHTRADRGKTAILLHDQLGGVLLAMHLGRIPSLRATPQNSPPPSSDDPQPATGSWRAQVAEKAASKGLETLFGAVVAVLPLVLGRTS